MQLPDRSPQRPLGVHYKLGTHSEVDASSVRDLFMSISPDKQPLFVRQGAMDDSKIRAMLDNSLELVLAYSDSDSTLVGLCAAIGDGELTATITVLALHPVLYKEQGAVASRLVRTVCRLLRAREIFDIGAIVRPSFASAFAQGSFGDDPLESTLMIYQGGKEEVAKAEFRSSAKLTEILKTKP